MDDKDVDEIRRPPSRVWSQPQDAGLPSPAFIQNTAIHAR
jgi:hypothetical protein